MGIPTAPRPDGRPRASGHMLSHSVLRSSYQRAYDNKPSRSFPTSGSPAMPPAPLPLRALAGLRAIVSPPCSIFSRSRVMSVLNTNASIHRALHLPFFLSYFSCGQALLLRAPSFHRPFHYTPTSPPPSSPPCSVESVRPVQRLPPCPISCSSRHHVLLGLLGAQELGFFCTEENG
ncbi:hypothetical protein CGRA01v4_01243 [Colletotrichum graminicola]|nr:hypothetical protein CGRA01v4_01243 [Colletotrichum graminicola]